MLNKNWGVVAKLTCVILLFLVVVGIANKQISYILVEGSIFKWLRDFIAVKAYEGNFSILFPKLHELFNCPLCMTGQIGLWLTLFLVILTYKWWPFKIRPLTFKKAISFLLVWFVMAMALAGAGYFWWNILEHKSRTIKLQEQFYSEKLEILRLSKDCKEIEVQLTSLLSQKEFSNIFNEIEGFCSAVCPCKRHRCRQNKMKDLVEKFVEKEGYSVIVSQRLLGLLQMCGKEYPQLFTVSREGIIVQAYQRFVGWENSDERQK